MEIEQFKSALSDHDWYYAFSDDNRVFKEGELAESKLMTLAENGGGEFMRAYNEVYAKKFHHPPFSKPWTFPFPQAQPV